MIASIQVMFPLSLSGGGAPSTQVQSDWGQTNSMAVDFIKNKPTIPAPAQSISSGDNGYATGAQVYAVVGDIETLLAGI